MTSINTANIKKSLATMSTRQLKRQLKKISTEYQGKQITALPDMIFDDWCKHIELIELAIEAKENSKGIDVARMEYLDDGKM